MMAQQVSNVRLISYSQELVDGKPVYASSNCLPQKVSKYEPAGHSFHVVALRLSGYCEEDSDKDDDKSASNDKEQTFTPSFESYSGKSKKKSGGDGKQQDHYALLGLAHLRYLATEEQIRKSYRDVALKYHPDKQAALLLQEETEASKQTKKDEIENHFKAIQEAYELLIDPQKRRMYDSTDEFDDEIPTDCAPQDFFKVFGPAFMRNSRWSVHQPAPSLGVENSSFDEVDKFYNFWYSFKSWREFPHADEFDLEQAESRDHKRWMERQNAKLSEKARKEEYTRVRSLVDNAYKRDPRIAKRKEFEKAEKKRKKEAKFLAKKLEEEEAVRIAEMERHKKEEEDRKAAETALLNKKAKEKEKKLLRKERTRLRSLAAEVASDRALDISGDDVETLCMSLDMLRLRGLCDKIEGKEKEEQVKFIKDSLSGKVHDEESSSCSPNPKPKQTVTVEANGNMNSPSSLEMKEKEKQKEKDKEKPWAKEEIDLLRKGMQKFPKGTSRRWEVISEYIGTGRSVEEILKATKSVLLQKPDSSKAFDSFLEKRKPAATISSPLSTRDEVQVVPIVNGTETGSGLGADASSSATSTDTPNAPSSTDSSSASSGSSDPDVWSSVQERALIQALKTFPKETPQRWERVATAVPGKTMIQCKKKFASLKETFRSKKTAA